MSADKSSSSTKVLHDEPSQTANTTIDNQDIKKDDPIATDDKSSSPKDKVDQTTTSDANTNENTTSTPDQFEATTNDSAKASTSINENNSSPPVVQTTTTPETSTNQAPEISTNDPDVGKHATTISNHESQNSPTAQIPDSDSANKQANMTGTDHDSQKISSTTMVPTSNEDANSVEQTNPPTDDSNNKKATNELNTNKDDDHGNQLPAVETSTSQIPDTNTNNQDNTNTTHGSPKSSTTTVATSNQDSNFVDQTNQPTADSDTKQATDQSTDTTNTDQQPDKQENLMPTDESSTCQKANYDANKQANVIATDESPKTSTTKVPDSNEDPNSVDLTNPPTTDGGTKQDTDGSTQTASTDSETDMKAPSSFFFLGYNEDRNHLQNLIQQELDIVNKISPKLGEHEKAIKKVAEIVTERFGKLKSENGDLQELKNLQKKITKLKLQIPAKYYYENDKQNIQQSDVQNREGIPIKLLKKLPRLHDELFHESPICKAIHLRFNELSYELKLCLLCFSVLPEKAIISRRSMVYWWIGEGFIPVTREYEAEKCANEFFNELMHNDFIEPVSRSYGRYVPICKMNPMVRAALVMIADKVNFFDFDEYGNPKNLGKFDEIESPEDMPEVHPLGDPREFFDFYNLERDSISISEPIKFFDSNGIPSQFAALNQDPMIEPKTRDGKPIDLSKKYSPYRKYYLYRKKKITTKSQKVCLVGSGLSKGIPWENLHMLFNVNDVILELKTEWFLRMKNVNILFFGRWHSSAAYHIEIDQEFEFEKSLDQMKHVRFFCLKGVSSISKLPDSISKLKSLVILDLRACHDLETVPESIGSLKCLTHLDMSECYLLKNIPKEISFLESLQVLKGFLVVESSEKGTCTLQDLSKLKNLRKLSMYTHMKDFPQESHLNALENFESLLKLTILWGISYELLSQSNKPGNKKKKSFISNVTSLIPRKKRVKGSLQRRNAFGSSTLGFRLQKLDLRCFQPGQETDWLKASKFTGLKKLYIRGGKFSNLGQYDNDITEWNDSTVQLQETWNVEILRLKYLDELNMEWRELQTLFPKLISLEKVKCPGLTLFPCNEQGIWMKKGYSKTT